MRPGRSPQRPAPTPTIPSWPRPWKNGPSSCSPACFRVSIRSWRRSTAGLWSRSSRQYPGRQGEDPQNGDHLRRTGAYGTSCHCGRLFCQRRGKAPYRDLKERGIKGLLRDDAGQSSTIRPTASPRDGSCFTETRFWPDWVTDKIGNEWITDLSNIKKLASLCGR